MLLLQYLVFTVKLAGDHMFVTFIFTTHSRLFAENENSNDFSSYRVINNDY